MALLNFHSCYYHLITSCFIYPLPSRVKGRSRRLHCHKQLAFKFVNECIAHAKNWNLSCPAIKNDSSTSLIHHTSVFTHLVLLTMHDSITGVQLCKRIGDSPRRSVKNSRMSQSRPCQRGTSRRGLIHLFLSCKACLQPFRYETIIYFSDW